MIQQAARDFAAKELAPYAAAWDRDETFPADAVKKMAELGFLGINVPTEYGGAGFDMVSYVLAMEEVSAACASTGVIMSVNNSLVCWPLNLRQRGAEEAFLTPLARASCWAPTA